MLDADVTSSTMNCFCELFEAEEYHGNRLYNEVWTAADDTTKEKALVSATRLLNTLSWRGIRTDATQPLTFPRKGLDYTESADSIQIIEVDEDSVPAAVKDATAELALVLLTSDVQASAGTEGFSSIRVGAVSLKINASDRSTWLTGAVRELVKHFLASGGSTYTASTMRAA